MFGGLGRCFEEDPFFRDPFAAHHEYMRQMMRSFSDPFGRDPFLSITDGGERTVDRRARQDSQVAVRGNRRATSYSLMPFAGFGRVDADFGEPFFAMDRMMSNMRNSMLEMQRKFVKETRKALRDSESGLQKMAIGHHIHDRAHVIKKSKNSKTGDEEMNQEFINLDETEARTFDEEWQKEIMKFKPSRTRCNLEAPKYRSIHHIPKEDGSRREKPLAVAGSREPRASLENLSVKGTHVPIKSSKK
ncbi:myeloid leukemia factor 1 isoform X6 [Rissa tridactyla]|uniref:myeloid leukemia factor 1 isoform X6 n=1 Tax=Rissa tridactyla TaxID=75485 RepID=UPI0023BA7E22|nr:myeloid leukemia factor 1 isoform X6 [Rissa tridactyla]